MSYVAAIPVEFASPRHTVYLALIDLGTHPQWMSGMTSISEPGPMRPGLRYESTAIILGHTNKSSVEVVTLVPDEMIALKSHAGLVKFKVEYVLTDRAPRGCVVTCNLRLEFSSAVFNLAQPVIEAVAESRITGDLESLRSRIESDG